MVLRDSFISVVLPPFRPPRLLFVQFLFLFLLLHPDFFLPVFLLRLVVARALSLPTLAQIREMALMTTVLLVVASLLLRIQAAVAAILVPRAVI